MLFFDKFFRMLKKKNFVWVDWFLEVVLFKVVGLEFRNYVFILCVCVKKIVIKKVGKNVMIWIFGNNINNIFYLLFVGCY